MIQWYYCNADARKLGYLRCILSCFEGVSGLKINLAKSKIYQVGDDCESESLAWILGWKIGRVSAMYLGLPLGASYKSKTIWEPVIEKISSKLDSWKAHLLSKGGCLTLIKETVAVMPNYFLSLFTIPISVANRMEAMFRRFLWHAEHHKYHLVD